MYIHNNFSLSHMQFCISTGDVFRQAAEPGPPMGAVRATGEGPAELDHGRGKPVFEGGDHTGRQGYRGPHRLLQGEKSNGFCVIYIRTCTCIYIIVVFMHI